MRSRAVGDIERLVHAAGAGDGVLAESIESIGAEAVARIVMAEVVDRADLRGCPPVAVSFRLRTEGTITEMIVDKSGSGVTAHPATAAAASRTDATVEQSLVEVVRGVFGPRGAGSSATRVLRWRDIDGPESFGRPALAFEPVRRLLDSIDRPYHTSLAEWCVRSGSDKWGVHQYPQHYERHFDPIRDRPLTILEIGVGGYDDPHRGGESLRMWKRYFPRAAIFGLDIVDKTALSTPRLTVLQGDQSSATDLERVVRATGPLDIIIDDGSHISAHVITAFHTLFPALRDGGVYVVEDLQTSYWPHFGGKSGAYNDISTSMGFLKAMLDGLNHEEIDGREPAPTDAAIKGMHFYHNMAFLEKGENRDGGAPSWLSRI
ncbi:class I SAM-dependent methyltransferase [Nocardia sp. BMG51109]|uniref:class I SAM-dependent methyltransferase n=1 Tax=Nocardia sp. BMG51109 TaxID=1056816 RepID=UPI0005626F2D|nr:class I SAM-dependent methyltransferase [Nocardia sp. BMG51109]